MESKAEAQLFQVEGEPRDDHLPVVGTADQFHRSRVNVDLPEAVLFPVATSQRPHEAVGLDTDGNVLHKGIQPFRIVGRVWPVEELPSGLVLLLECLWVFAEQPGHRVFAKLFQDRRVESIPGIMTALHRLPVLRRNVVLFR